MWNQTTSFQPDYYERLEDHPVSNCQYIIVQRGATVCSSLFRTHLCCIHGRPAPTNNVFLCYNRNTEQRFSLYCLFCLGFLMWKPQSNIIILIFKTALFMNEQFIMFFFSSSVISKTVWQTFMTGCNWHEC